jgi:putative DNA primase/helicase
VNTLLGAFDTLNGLPTAAALSLALKDGAAKHHGAVGLNWLRMLVQERAMLGDVSSQDLAKSVRAFVERNTSASTNGQALRVARRFGLVAAAGELATTYGLTDWKPGEASACVAACFEAWLAGFGGGGNREERALLAQVRAFFELHGASRFQPVEAVSPAGDEWRIANRAGYSRTGEDGAREFLVLPEVFRRELCEGFDPKAAAQALVEAGVLLPGKDGKASRSERLPGVGTARVYVVTGKVWEAEE